MDTVAIREVVAFNTAKASENRIHDDTIARRFGFTGGLVPGVDVYAYMAHAAVARWGRAWLGQGTAQCRFAKPVYDGAVARVSVTQAGQDIAIEVISGGVSCAAGGAALPAAEAAPPISTWPEPPEPPAERPAADGASLAVGRALGIRRLEVTSDFAAAYCADVREDDPIYAREGLVHPGLILRTCNWALTHNVVLGPWIHVGSTVRNFAPANVGGTLSVRAVVTGNYEHKGHLFVELDVGVLCGAAVVARVAHTAIYRPRQVG